MNLLVAIGALGAAGPAKLCRALDLEKSTVSRNVERMVQNGWIDALPGEDGRAIHYRLTRKGKGLLKRALPDWRSAQARASKLLGRAGVQALDDLARGLGLQA